MMYAERNSTCEIATSRVCSSIASMSRCVSIEMPSSDWTATIRAPSRVASAS
jgi:hypothetical protein